MRYIENRLLHYFVAVAEEQHFARAAERLGITPPTLTQQIQKLESELGARLLRRKGHTKVAVTEAGQRVLAHAREVLRQVEQTAVIARQAERGELGHLQLGFVMSVFSAGLLKNWTDAFQQANPAIDITVRKMLPMAQIAGILGKELDAGLTRVPHKCPSGVRSFEIYRQRLAVALPSEHPLTQREHISPAMLADEAFVNITAELDVAFSGHLETIAGLGNFTPRVVKRDDDFVDALAYVALGRGIAVVPELLKTMNVPDVVFRNISADPAPQTSISFVYGSDPSPSTKLLIRYMRRLALRNGGKGAASPHNHDRIIIPSALNLDPHPQVRAAFLRAPRRASEDLSPQKRGARRRKRTLKHEAKALGPRPSRLGAARRAPQG